MTKVVTQLEIMKHKGMDTVVLKKGTIVTPSAKDWAAEQGINIVFSDGETKKDIRTQNEGAIERSEFLRTTVRTFAEKIEQVGKELNKETLYDAVIKGCIKMGCTIDS